MANLDGSRRNGARYEVEVAARLLASQDHLAEVYRTIVRSARDVGVSVTDLPDFLDLEQDEAPLTLLGQDRLSSYDIEDAVRAEQQEPADPMTELLLIAAARIGQHRFARQVLRNHGHRCVFCGLSVGVDKARVPRMLVASHIKPWRISTPRERLDVANGLTACPTHDVAFDTGLLTVNGGLRIHIHASVQATAHLDTAVRAAFGRPPLGEKLLLPMGAVPPQRAYLEWHRTHVYRGLATT
ncbi:HNH endonuclease [Micromonospora chersina]|uniref:HNH endonuclease n=1 Tax=Micromonospora chersina TaxID=47854 RepID=UPI003680999C